MKIGIFGDSFADEHMKPSRSWVECLRENYDYDDVTSYGYGGTSLEWSYTKFLEYNSKYDLCIFLFTDMRRQHYYDNETKKELLFHVSADRSDIEMSQKMLDGGVHESTFNFAPSSSDRKILKSLEELTLLYQNSFDWKNSAIYDSILYRRPNSVIIDFDSMLRLQKIDYDYIGLKLRNAKGEGKNRPCHMSLRQNEEFAEYINDNIKNGISILETLKEPEKHYTISKTDEEADIIW